MQPQWPSAPTPAVSPPPVAAEAAQAPATTPPSAAPPVMPQPVQPQPLTPLQQEDRARLLKMARDASLTPAATVRDAEDRMERWKMVMLVDPADVEARLGYEQAQKALDAARARDETARTTREARDRELSEKRDRLRMAERALYTRDLDGAGGILEDVLRQHPDDPRAASLTEMLRDARRAQEVRRRLVFGAAGLLVVALLVAAWARGAYRARRQEAPPATERPRALVRIVDGVGRGKLVPITQDILRIGAAEDAENGDLNDLVVSDDGAAVSRYHCAIVRKGGDYLLLDSSLNGTRLNGRRLPRGEHHVLRHGDEFVLAGSSRLKFLRT
ncbi:MAG TPA: FHA domain-containing protein [Longimicrobium sp.]